MKNKPRLTRHILIAIIILKNICLFAQSDSTIFNSEFKLNNGIFTSYEEILKNAPSYPDCAIEVKPNSVTGEGSLYYEGSIHYYDKESVRQSYNGALFAIVDDGTLRIQYQHQLYKLILKGAISTFFIETIKNNSMGTYATGGISAGSSETKDKLYYVDLKTGNINKLNIKNINEIIKRDSVLYASFSALSDGKKRKTLYSFILKYNARNPIYIKPNKAAQP